MPGWNEPLSAFVFISAAFKSSAVLCAAGVIVLLLRRQSAAARHLIWTTGFIVLLMLPFFSVSMPTIPVSPRLFPSEVAFQVVSAIAPDKSKAQSQSPGRSAELPMTTQRLPDWRMALLLLWCAGTVVSLGQMLAALVAMRRIRRAASPLIIPDLALLSERLNVRCPVELFESRRGTMPMTFGLFQPSIFLPPDVLEKEEGSRGLTILHELAHVRRRDTVTHMLVRVVLSIYWWNPLAWFAWREFLKERERAADDLVLNAGACPSEYANHLLEIATRMQSRAALGAASVAMARRSQLEGRLIAILDNGRNRRDLRSMSVLSSAILAILIAAPLAALQSQDQPSSSPPAGFATARISGERGRAHGIGLLHLADLEYEQGEFNEARPLYAKAIPLLGNTPEGATALLHMGTMALISKNRREAIDDFSRAQALNSADAGQSDMWMAIAQEQEGFPAQADSSYQGALKKSDPNSALAATIMELYAQFMRRHGRENEAKPLREQSSAIRKTLGAQEMSKVQNTPNVYRIGGDVTVPVLLSKVEPEYSQDARAAKYQGSVLLYVEIGVDGTPHKIIVSRGLGLGLDEKAIQAVRQWKFKPSTKDGQPVAVNANIEVNFRIL